MRRLMKGRRRGEKGFTLIELLIVIAILGILAAVVIPNAAGFMITGTLNAANTEAANIKTAAVGFMAENEGVWPDDSSQLTDYYAGTLKATYYFWTYVEDPAKAGFIEDAVDADPGWGIGTKIMWDEPNQKFVRYVAP